MNSGEFLLAIFPRGFHHRGMNPQAAAPLPAPPAAGLFKKIKSILIGVLVGLVVLVGTIWLLTKTLGNFHETRYDGQPIAYWQQQLNGHDTGASNQAFAVVNAQIIPQLLDQMFHDTNDSKIRLAAIDMLNGIPGIQIGFTPTEGRRSAAAESLGEFGPAAKATVPTLIGALNGKDPVLHAPAIHALGDIHSDPEVVIPILISCLTNDDLNDEAATALGNYGSLSKAAVPKIIPLLKAPSKEARAAARTALKKIDPIAAAKAGVQ
jgi:HEAT repeat protein